MKILVVKTSSMGDVIHTLPALTDASQAYPDIQFTWVVEESLVDIPTWHPHVTEVIPVALRRWRKNPIAAIKSGEWQRFRKQLRVHQYDKVIDAQGLLKSALVTYLARGKRCGLNWRSAWEPLASLIYQHRVDVAPSQHAVRRIRQLFSGCLDYSLPDTLPDYGLVTEHFPHHRLIHGNYLVFIHGTTWQNKQWPENYWQTLIELATSAGYQVCLPWGNTEERERALRLAGHNTHVIVLPKLGLSELAAILQQARGAVAVDTGLGHLAAALAVPTVSLYGPTDPEEIGTCGKNQRHLAMDFPCAPCNRTVCNYEGEIKLQPACFSMVAPQKVWENLREMI